MTQSRVLLELMIAYEIVVPGSSRNSLETDFVQEWQINRENICQPRFELDAENLLRNKEADLAESL